MDGTPSPVTVGPRAGSPFDPKPYVMKLKGKDYLEVKHRLQWLRAEHPDAVIVTEVVAHDTEKQWCLAKATVTLPTGGVATGYGSEDARDFGDYIEKAETKAIGRALGALGYGTQFADDHEFGAAEGHVVDAPVTPRTPASAPKTAAKSGGTPARQPARSAPAAATASAARPFNLPIPDPNGPDASYVCTGCGVVIEDDTRPGGYTAGQKAAFAVRKVGEIKCFDCRG